MHITEENFAIINVHLQFRFNSLQCGGLVIQVQQTLPFAVINLDMVGYNFDEKGQSSNLINYVDPALSLTINISKMIVCTNIQYFIYNGLVSLVNLTEQPGHSCENICGKYTPVYGLCLNDLINGYFNGVNKTKYCLYPFVYNNSQCTCADGFLLNQSECIDVIQALSNLDLYIISGISNLDHQLFNNISDISNQMTNMQTHLSNYFDSTIVTLEQFVNNTVKNINDTQHQFQGDVQTNMSSMQIELQNVQLNFSMYKIIQDKLRMDLQSINISVQTKQQTLSNSLDSIQAQINSINTINSIQNTNITSLQNQLFSIQSNYSSAKQICNIIHGYGYCTNVNKYCISCNQDRVCDNPFIVKQYNCDWIGEITSAVCGTFIE
ncbi:Hypothetical_protein [Hexamita inflata]|uniref:Hypothetical_protein n=1 Tax=Hexamita inflata TaxID=28002 RepID=A0AA86UQ33_9EUKA|nr:Hypothetical protein HINF_LOCUS51389 [Hexamita inflata]